MPTQTRARTHPFTDHDTVREERSHMFAIDIRLRDAEERMAFLRAMRQADRRAERSARSIRSRLGAAIIAIGRRIGGDDLLTFPAWQG